MIPTIDEIKEIIENTEHANIDIKKTLTNNYWAGCINEDYMVLDPNNCDLPYLFKEEGLEYERSSDTFFDYIDKMMDDEGVYIALAFTPHDGGVMDGETIRRDVDGLDEDEIFYGCLTTWRNGVVFELPEDSNLTAFFDEHSDYGILLKREEEKIEITYAYNEYENYGPGGSQSIHGIEDELENPVYRLVIKLMSEAIVLKDE